MSKSELKSLLREFWNKVGKKELMREKNDPHKQIHTDLLWREIKRCLNGRSKLKILDAGAGPGRFSIYLAQDEHEVVHLDISDKMIEIAKEFSQNNNINNISFIRGDICKGFEFESNSFDLVICFDSPLSYCYKNYEFALSELLRVTKERLILCVSNRTGIIFGGGTSFELKHFGKLTVSKEIYKTGTLEKNEELINADSKVMPINWHAFTPDEIRNLIEKYDCVIEKISAPGTLASGIENKLLKKLLENRKNYEEFLDFEEKFDSNKNMLGVGSRVAGGLLITALKKFKAI